MLYFPFTIGLDFKLYSAFLKGIRMDNGKMEDKYKHIKYFISFIITYIFQ